MSLGWIQFVTFCFDTKCHGLQENLWLSFQHFPFSRNLTNNTAHAVHEAQISLFPPSRVGSRERVLWLISEELGHIWVLMSLENLPLFKWPGAGYQPQGSQVWWTEQAVTPHTHRKRSPRQSKVFFQLRLQWILVSPSSWGKPEWFLSAYVNSDCYGRHACILFNLPLVLKNRSNSGFLSISVWFSPSGVRCWYIQKHHLMSW